MEIPVISTSAPLVIQFGPTLQSYDLLPVTIGTFILFAFLTYRYARGNRLFGGS